MFVAIFDKYDMECYIDFNEIYNKRYSFVLMVWLL